MRGAEWAERALRLMADGRDADPETARRTARLRLLVEDRLRTSELGAAALARLRSEPGEGAFAIAVSVLADEAARDPAFASFLAEAVTAASATPGAGGAKTPAGPPPPPLPPGPPLPAAYPGPGVRPPLPPLPPHLAMSAVWIWLLGLPTTLFGYVVSAVFHGIGPILLLVLMVGGLGTAVVWGVRLLRRYRSASVLAATVVHALVLLLLLASFLASVA
ncbi:hypothetical protein [Streptomyces sp. NPDC047974]|uniref:hypothetical protein n=1 Tax=Streptomyces sp. NPDC047974 TaxID=3154343 RepID=UPI0033E516E2